METEHNNDQWNYGCEITGKYPQESYASVLRAIQLECIISKRSTKNMGDDFAGTFSTRLFFIKFKYLTPPIGTLSTMMIQKAGLGLHISLKSAEKKFLSFLHATTELIQTVTGKVEFFTANQLLVQGRKA